MREMTVGVVAPAYVNVPLWVAQERGSLERRGLSATCGRARCGARAPTSLNLGSPADAAPGLSDRLDAVTGKLAGHHPEWIAIRSMLIRPDGYLAWATHGDDAPPLAAWLGQP